MTQKITMQSWCVAVSLCDSTLGQQAEPLPVVRVGCFCFLPLSSISQAVFFAWSQLRPRGQPSELIMRDCIIFSILRFQARNRRESTIIIHCCYRKETVKSSPFKGKLGEN